MAKTMIIRAEKTSEGYQLICEDGDYPQESRVHKSKQAAYADAVCLWPANSTWEGKKIHAGYRIVID